MRLSERPEPPGPEGRLSLVLPITEGRILTDENLAEYRRILEELGAFESIEVVIAAIENGRAGKRITDLRLGSEGGAGSTHVKAEGGEWSILARAGLSAATGDHLMVLDVDRYYPPESLVPVIESLRTGSSDLAVAVPTLSRSLLGLWRRSWLGLGLVSRLLLGSSDVFSGLFAIRRSVWEEDGRFLAEGDSSLVLELLMRQPARCVDVPVAVDDRFRSQRARLQDLRPLKHVLDGRFGNFSRLIQFCVVGASGMVVDLSFYALFQWLLSFTSIAAQRSKLFGFSWQLAIAGALSIAIALVWNFTLNRRLTFNDAKKGAWLRQFLTYALSNSLAIAVSFSLRLYLPVRIGFFARHRLAAAVVGIVVATGISFSMSRWIVFSRRAAPKPPTHFPPKPRLGRPSAVV
jgi:dolichol-phosphate mannosyltransferase